MKHSFTIMELYTAAHPYEKHVSCFLWYNLLYKERSIYPCLQVTDSKTPFSPRKLLTRGCFRLLQTALLLGAAFSRGWGVNAYDQPE